MVMMLADVLSWVWHRGVGQQLVLRRLVLLLVVPDVGRPVMVMVTVVMGVDGDGDVATVMHSGTVAVAIIATGRRLLARRV